MNDAIYFRTGVMPVFCSEYQTKNLYNIYVFERNGRDGGISSVYYFSGFLFFVCM